LLSSKILKISPAPGHEAGMRNRYAMQHLAYIYGKTVFFLFTLL
jgi:hypothetical protein